MNGNNSILTVTRASPTTSASQPACQYHRPGILKNPRKLRNQFQSLHTKTINRRLLFQPATANINRRYIPRLPKTPRLRHTSEHRQRPQKKNGTNKAFRPRHQPQHYQSYDRRPEAPRRLSGLQAGIIPPNHHALLHMFLINNVNHKTAI